MDSNRSYIMYEEPWEMPESADLNTLRNINTSLKFDTEEQTIQYSLQYLHTAINDFPAEYFLQPPYIFQTLKILFEEKHIYHEELLRIFSNLTNSICKSIKIKRLSLADKSNINKIVEKNQITVTFYTNEIFRFVIRVLNDFEREPESKIYLCFKLLLDIINLLNFGMIKDISFNEILIELSELSKKFRQNISNNTLQYSNRNNYLVCLHLIAKLCLLKYNKTIDQTSQSAKSNSNNFLFNLENLSVESKDEASSIWFEELIISLYDYPLKCLYNQIYEQIFEVVKLQHDSIFPLTSLENVTPKLSSLIDLIKDHKKYSPEEIISKGIEGLDVLALFNSTELVQIFFEAILDVNNKNDINIKSLEEMLIRLLAHDNFVIKRKTYQLCADRIKSTFGKLMSESFGNMVIQRRINIKNLFGFPCTIDVLSEIISFGYSSSDKMVSKSAEVMLILILKSKNVVRSFWSSVLEVLIPLLPLLQCYISDRNELGKYILDFVMNETGLSFLQSLQCSIRVLFCNENDIRSKGIARILDLLLSHPSKTLYLPNIENLMDIIPDDVCLLHTPLDPKNIFVSKRMQVSKEVTVQTLLELLKSKDTEPAVRESTLNQINIIAEDTYFLNVFLENNGLLLLLNGLEKCLSINQSLYYIESAIPIIGIICKICISFPQYRKGLSVNINVHILLIRALILFYENLRFKTDCVVTIFLLVYNDYCLGSHKISIPKIYLKLKMPFYCENYWNESRFSKSSMLESYLLKGTTFNEQQDIIRITSWQYLRMLFGSIWTNGFDSLIKISSKSNDDRNLHKNINVDKNLCLTNNDWNHIIMSVPENGMKNFINEILNSISYKDALSGLAKMNKHFLIPQNFQFETNEILIISMKFLSVTPSTDNHAHVITSMLILLNTFIVNDNTNILLWAIRDIEGKTSIFTNILKAENISQYLYQETCELIANVLKTINNDNKSSISTEHKNQFIEIFYHRFYELLPPVLENFLQHEDLSKLRSLTKLFCIVSQKYIDIDDVLLVEIINKLFQIISEINLFSQAGANLIKNCLFSINNIVNKNKVKYKTQYLKPLAGLCGHIDVEVRTLSWTILLNKSTNSEELTLLNNELSFLPGGFMNCCINTCIDNNESTIIRGISGCVFSNLLPLCENESYNSSFPNGDIVEMLAQQNFFKYVSEFFKSNTTKSEKINDITTLPNFNMVRIFCIILSDLIHIKNGLFDESQISDVVVNAVRIIPTFSHINDKKSILALSEICNLLALCFYYKNEIMTDISIQDHSIISTIIKILDMRNFDNFDKRDRHNTLRNLILGTKILTSSTIGIQNFLLALNDNNFSTFFNVILYTLRQKNNDGLTGTTVETLLTIFSDKSHKEIIFNFLHSVTFDDQVNENYSASDVIFIHLYDLLVICTNGSRLWKTIAKCLAILLKESHKARFSADSNSFLSYLLGEIDDVYNKRNISKTFLGNRLENSKVSATVVQISTLFEIILNWYCVEQISDPENIIFFCKVSINIWHLSEMEHNFQLVFVHTLAFLSEDSLPVCKAYSTYRPGSKSCILQKLIDYALSSIQNIQNVKVNVMEIIIRTITNCCACTEGRLLLSKINIMDTVNNFRPLATKHQAIWNEIALNWLKFYEVFTRYSDYVSVRHVSLFCTFITKFGGTFRIISLKILRNMAFGISNKPLMLNSDELLYTLQTVIENGTSEERLIVLLTIWKLVANNYKNKHKVRMASIYKRLLALHQESLVEKEQQEESYILNVLYFVMGELKK